MGLKINKKLFNEQNEKLVKDIANQYIEIFKIVKNVCPKYFTKDEVTLIFIKTEVMFNNFQVQLAKKNKKKNRNGNGNGKTSLPKESERTKEYYA